MKIQAHINSDSLRERLLAERIRARLRADLERELQPVAVGGETPDPDVRRDALERAVRRVWGATL
jgi:hypothetical protein